MTKLLRCTHSVVTSFVEKYAQRRPAHFLKAGWCVGSRCFCNCMLARLKRRSRPVWKSGSFVDSKWPRRPRSWHRDAAWHCNVGRGVKFGMNWGSWTIQNSRDILLSGNSTECCNLATCRNPFDARFARFALIYPWFVALALALLRWILDHRTERRFVWGSCSSA